MIDIARDFVKKCRPICKRFNIEVVAIENETFLSVILNPLTGPPFPAFTLMKIDNEWEINSKRMEALTPKNRMLDSILDGFAIFLPDGVFAQAAMMLCFNLGGTSFLKPNEDDEIIAALRYFAAKCKGVYEKEKCSIELIEDKPHAMIQISDNVFPEFNPISLTFLTKESGTWRMCNKDISTPKELVEALLPDINKEGAKEIQEMMNEFIGAKEHVDFAKMSRDVDEYLHQRGLRPDDVVQKAAVHFQAPVSERRCTPLTTDELKLLIEDEEQYDDRPHRPD